MGHYELDVEPAGIRLVQRQYAAMAEALADGAGRVRGTPGEIGDDWQGSTATVVKGDMERLTGLLGTYRGHLDDAAEALATLATAYHDGLETLGRLNRRYTDAQADCAASLKSLDRQQDDARDDLDVDGLPPNRFAHEELADRFGRLRSDATGELDRVVARLDARYEEVVEECRAATTTCAGVLSRAVHVQVPADITLNLSDPSAAKAAYLAMYDAAEERLGDDLGLLQERDEHDDGDKLEALERVEEMLSNYSNFPPEDRSELLEILQRYSADPEFAGMLAGNVDLQLLGNALARAQDGPWADGTPTDESDAYNRDLMTALGQVLGMGTMAAGDYAISDDRVDAWYDAITASYDGTADVVPGSQTQLAALMAQGAWDPALLADLTERVLVFERDELDGSDGWDQHTGGADGFTPDGYLLDPVQALALALSRNRSAAQHLLADAGKRTLELDSGDVEVSHTLAYLLLEREWPGANGESAIAALLGSALSDKPGDELPAELARELQGIVDYGEEQTRKAEEEAERHDKPWFVDLGHLLLDLGGLLPFIGEPADLINAGWYEAEGDHLNASLSAAGAVPFLGWAATGGKLGLKGLKGVASADLLATLTKRYADLGDDVAFDLFKVNGTEVAALDFKTADAFAAALRDPIPDAVYRFGDTLLRTDADGVVSAVGGAGAMRRFMKLGDSFKHLPAGTEIRYAGHVFRKTDTGALELIAVSRYKPIWGHGEAFNAQNWHRYRYNEVYLSNGARLDSYEPGKWIVERKFRQYADLQDATRLRKDIDLLKSQYGKRWEIPSTPGNRRNFPDAIGKLRGDPLLEIPPQLRPLDPDILKYAATRRPPVTIRDTDGRIYSYRFPHGRLP